MCIMSFSTRTYLSILCLIGVVASNTVNYGAKPMRCGLNQKAVKCRTICPPQNCETFIYKSLYIGYNCSKVQNICEPGCDCLPNYLRNGSGICILKYDCPYPSFPICRINEIARDCRKICPPQTCESRLALYKDCGDLLCEPGCDCVPNYLRNSDGLCIRADKCDLTPQCPRNERYAIDDVSCIRTCANKDLPWETMGACIPYTGCICKGGFYRKYDNKTGPCIKEMECR